MNDTIRQEHTKIMQEMKLVETFVVSNYANRIRTTLEQLAKVTHTDKDGTIRAINQWLDHLPFGSTTIGSITSKLAIFFTDFGKPDWFGELKLNNMQRVGVHAAHNQFDFPGHAHIKLFQKLHVSDEKDAWKVDNTQTNNLQFVETYLRCKGMLTEESYRSEGQSNHSIVSQKIRSYDSMWISADWGRQTYAFMDGVREGKFKDKEVVAIGFTNENDVMKEKRKELQSVLSEFAKYMTGASYHLIRVTNVKRMEGKHKISIPSMTFIKDDDLMSQVTVQFNMYPDVARFILN
ncbi:hypothetical protein PHABIO_248 [Pseudomonas phage Phabio]|uniref:Uncharacterized protein n=1 Tax=Pseudomonas phage Phabio TaxID=2006668 RepID=A0A1Y0SZD7_9CAUD|nr:hypothetical protein MZD05_gp248 [Pseudomonas phage Phabio]ARV76879.1 hypothetical protein PHABIO_248 [Pseudomonas phage Phabio]